MNLVGIAAYALAWLLFAAAHSLFARPEIQRPVETCLRGGYRMLYNLLSLGAITIVLFVGNEVLDNQTFSVFDCQLVIMAFSASGILGLCLMLVAISSYDIGRFFGFTQIVTGEHLGSAATEPLQRRGLNRWARHPLYTGAFVVLWSGATSTFGCWTALWGSLYLVIGSEFEERKLVRVYGVQYQQYQQQVPRFFPRFDRLWTWLTEKV